MSTEIAIPKRQRADEPKQSELRMNFDKPLSAGEFAAFFSSLQDMYSIYHKTYCELSFSDYDEPENWGVEIARLQSGSYIVWLNALEFIVNHGSEAFNYIAGVTDVIDALLNLTDQENAKPFIYRSLTENRAFIANAKDFIQSFLTDKNLTLTAMDKWKNGGAGAQRRNIVGGKGRIIIDRVKAEKCNSQLPFGVRGTLRGTNGLDRVKRAKAKFVESPVKVYVNWSGELKSGNCGLAKLSDERGSEVTIVFPSSSIIREIENMAAELEVPVSDLMLRLEGEIHYLDMKPVIFRVERLIPKESVPVSPDF